MNLCPVSILERFTESAPPGAKKIKSYPVRVCTGPDTHRQAASLESDRIRRTDYARISLQDLSSDPVRGFYSRVRRISSGERGLRSAGATSSRLMQPVLPRRCIRSTALAQATSTEAVNSGLESSFRLNSMTW